MIDKPTNRGLRKVFRLCTKKDVVKKQRSKSRDFLLLGNLDSFFMPDRKNNYFG